MDWKEEESRKRELLQKEKDREISERISLYAIGHNALLSWWNKLLYKNRRLPSNIKLYEYNADSPTSEIYRPTIGCFSLCYVLSYIIKIDIDTTSGPNAIKLTLDDCSPWIEYDHNFNHIVIIRCIRTIKDGFFRTKRGFTYNAYYLDDYSIDTLLRNIVRGLLITTDLQFVKSEFEVKSVW